MTTNEFQKKCAQIVMDIDNKYGIERDLHLSFTQLIEEVGELAKELNLPRLRSEERDKENLKGEFADVIIQLSILANMLGVDFEDAGNSKITILKERHKL